MTLRRNRTAVHSHPDTMRAARRFGRAVIQVPHFEAPLVVPLNPFAIGLAVPILLIRKRAAGLVFELACAIAAIADTVAREAAPAIVGKSVRMATLDDLL